MLTVQPLYNALYKKPIYDIIYGDEKSKKLDIIIFGDSEEAMLCFKTVFWCGQLSFTEGEYRLKITVVSDNPESLRDKYLKAMPALFEYGLADISFEEKAGSYYETAVLLSENDMCVFDFTDEKPSFDAFSEDSRIRVYLNGKACNIPHSNNIETVQITGEENRELADLAFAVHFNYERDYNPYADRKKEYEKFYREENEYNRKSSFASALHIRYKLYSAGIGWFDSCNGEEMSEVLKSVSDIVEEKKNVYNNLIMLEHKRWTAYMISDGYVSPSDEEIEKYAFNPYEYNGKKGFIKSFKNNVYPPLQHPCIAPCNNKGIVLNRMSKKQWEKLSDEEIKKLDELDRVSVKLHRIAVKKADEYKKQIFALIGGLSEYAGAYYETAGLKIIAEMLYNENSRAEKLWKKNIKAISEKLKYNEEATEKINTLKNLMTVVTERNLYHDYKLSDSNFIDMLPFIIYSVKPYKTLVKFYSEDIISNVSSASSLLPERIAFFGIDKNDTEFAKSVNHFLMNRHVIDESSKEKKEIIFYYCDLKSAEELCRRFFDFIKKNNINADECIIDITGASPNYSVSAGVISSETGIPLIRFDNNKGIRTVMGGGKLRFNTGIPKVSINELYELLNCHELFRLSHNDALSISDDMDRLYAVFSEYKNVWTTAVGVIRNLKSDSVIFQRTTSYKEEHKNDRLKRYSGIIPKESFEGKELDSLLSNLEKLGIIDNLSISGKEDGYKTEFDYYDDIIIEKIIGNENNYPIQFKFFGTNAKFVQHSLKVTRAVLGKDVKQEVLDVLNKANKYELIKGLRIDECGDGRYISFEYANNLVKKALTVDGAVLELFVYYTAFESNYFDDVKNNFEFLWNTVNDGILYASRRFTGLSGFKSSNYIMPVDSVKNEVDVIVTRNFKIKLISCKAGKVDQFDLMQVKYLSERFGGYGKAILAYSNDGAKKENQTSSYDSTRKRATEMDVDFIEPKVIFGDKNDLLESLKYGM